MLFATRDARTRHMLNGEKGRAALDRTIGQRSTSARLHGLDHNPYWVTSRPSALLAGENDGSNCRYNDVRVHHHSCYCFSYINVVF